MDNSDLTAEQVLKRVIPWETYMATKLISGTSLKLLRRYDKKSPSYRAVLLDEEGGAYVRVFVGILNNIHKEETVEYVLALMDEMLTENRKAAALFHDESIADQDMYETLLRLLWHGNSFVQEKSCKILTLVLSVMPKVNGVQGDSERNSIDALLQWLCRQLKSPSHSNQSFPTAVNSLSILLKEPQTRLSFLSADGLKNLLTPLLSPASTPHSIQLLYETCLCLWLLSFSDESATQYIAMTQMVPRLIDVLKSTSKEKVVRVIALTLKNLHTRGGFDAQMVDLGVIHIVQNLRAQSWTDEDLLETLAKLEEGLRESLRKLSSFDKYKQEVLLGHFDCFPMHKDPVFWRENATRFEENDFQVLRVLVKTLDTSGDAGILALVCFDLSQFVKHHPAGRVILNNLKVKERVMKLMNSDSSELSKNALLCVQRLFLGSKYAAFLQP